MTPDQYVASKGSMPDLVRLNRLLYARTGFPCHLACESCGTVGYPWWMVHDHVWEQAFETRWGMCCLDCFEDRLGRPVGLDDLRDCPLSDWLFIRFLNGESRHAPPHLPPPVPARPDQYAKSNLPKEARSEFRLRPRDVAPESPQSRELRLARAKLLGS